MFDEKPFDNEQLHIMCVLPWRSLDAEASESYYGESQEHISQCLHCTKSQCVNCQAGKRESMINTLEEFEQMLAEKKSRSEICTLMNITRSTYFRYKEQLAAYA
jgi:response regulator of citrate/malate metabolism